MKKLSLLGLSLAVLLSSCLKDPKPEPTGEAYVRAVNTVQGSVDQDFYINGTIKSTTPITYGEASEYFTITSGANQMVFADQGTTTGNAGGNYNIPIGEHITAYFYEDKDENLGMVPVGEDMTAPESGKAKVRFIHLNRFLTTVPLSISMSGTPLITSLSYGNVSNYYNVDAGAKFTLNANGVISPPEVDPGIVAGKIYTIWIDGTAATDLSGHFILQN